MKLLRWFLLFVLFVMVQACAGIEHPGRRATMAGGPRPYVGPSLAAKVRSKELHGCTGERFRVDLLNAIPHIPDATLDAQREQVRDWLFLTTLGRIALHTDIGAAFTGIVDRPVVRDDALAHVLHLQTGPTRSTTTKNGDAVILVESAEDATMSARIFEAIDDEAVHTGATPSNAQVYQYVLEPQTAYAEVCAMPAFSRSNIESAALGYRTATLKTVDDFKQFLAEGADLLSAQCTKAGLEVKGRLRSRTTNASPTIEHLAALSQTRPAHYVPLDQLGFSWDLISDRPEVERQAREIERLKEPVDGLPKKFRVILEWKRKHPKVSTRDLLLSYMLQENAAESPGFSLDPHGSPKLALAYIDNFISALPDMDAVAKIFGQLNAETEAAIIRGLPAEKRMEIAAGMKASLTSMREKLLRANDAKVEGILQEKRRDTLAAQIVQTTAQTVWQASSRQCARYDGPLQGTATGMTFFYTDLLMKLWAFDWNGAAPEGPIEGFRSETHETSTLACGNEDHVATRFWLGVRKSAFKRERSDVIHFAPIATKLFAMSSIPGAPAEEFEADPSAKRFISWWNDHYADVAEWEPQYELLNQLMKWSIAMRNASVTEKDACFAALDKVAVRHDLRLDRWMAAQKDLAWRGAIKLSPPFEDFASKVPSGECMELLESKTFEHCQTRQHLSGGVSAGALRTVLDTPIRFSRSAPQLARLSGNTVLAETEAGLFQADRILTAGGKLENVQIVANPARTSLTAAIDSSASQNGSTVIWNNAALITRIENAITRSGSIVRSVESRNGLVTAELRMSDVARADIQVSIQRGPILDAQVKAQSIAKDMASLNVRLVDAAKGATRPTEQLFDLGHGRVAYQLNGPDKRPMVAIMESGIGSRGPPLTNVEASFTVGVNGTNTAVAEANLLRNATTVRVSIVPESVANPLINRGVGLVAPNSTRVTDLAQAIQKSDTASIVRVVDNAIAQGAKPAELRIFQQQIAEHAITTRRSMGDVAVLEELNFRLAIAERAQQAARLPSFSTPLVNTEQAVVYAPANYPAAAQLPPAVYNPGALSPANNYVVRVIEEVALTRAPESITVNGLNLIRHGTANPVVTDYGAVGSFLRLISGPAYPVYVVLKCSDYDPSLPRCH